MSEITPIMLTAIILTTAGFAINIPALLMWYVLHKLLSPRLDPILLREPYFNRAEQINYRFFPLYLVKAINYIYLVAWPTMAKKRRFKGLETPLPISNGFAAHLYISIFPDDIRAAAWHYLGSIPGVCVTNPRRVPRHSRH